MRKTIVAIVIGLTALAAMACNSPGTSPSLDPGLESMPAVESPSDMLESPSAS
jgi:hypothetical protein